MGKYKGILKAQERSMKIRFYKPFDAVAGREEMEIHLQGPMPLPELLATLKQKIPSFRPYIGQRGDEEIHYHLILVRDGEILRSEDRVYETDVVKVLPPISGG
jgi:molybdopterin converting factor small subunit